MHYAGKYVLEKSLYLGLMNQLIVTYCSPKQNSSRLNNEHISNILAFFYLYLLWRRICQPVSGTDLEHAVLHKNIHNTWNKKLKVEGSTTTVHLVNVNDKI